MVAKNAFSEKQGGTFDGRKVGNIEDLKERMLDESEEADVYRDMKNEKVLLLSKISKNISPEKNEVANSYQVESAIQNNNAAAGRSVDQQRIQLSQHSVSLN